MKWAIFAFSGYALICSITLLLVFMPIYSCCLKFGYDCFLIWKVFNLESFILFICFINILFIIFLSKFQIIIVMNIQDITLKMTWPYNHFRCYKVFSLVIHSCYDTNINYNILYCTNINDI